MTTGSILTKKRMGRPRLRAASSLVLVAAIGCALARTTCEVILFADTALGWATAPSEGFKKAISAGFNINNARDLADDLLRKKAILRGADLEDIETEVLEESQFNMIRGFQTIGKNIRVRMQLKPGLISEE